MIAPSDMGFGKGGALKYKGSSDIEDRTGAADKREPAVVLGTINKTRAGGIWSREPLATVRAEPRRFWIGIPLVFLVALGAGAAFREAGTEAALGALLVTQCLGFIALYVPAFRKRTDPMRTRLLPRNDLSPIDRDLARVVDAGGRAVPRVDTDVGDGDRSD